MRYHEVEPQTLPNQTCPSPTPKNGVSASHKNIYIELVSLAYYVYHKIGLSTDQQDFSVRILGKSRSYLSCMKARGRTPTQLVLHRLLHDVRLKRDGLAASRHLEMPYAKTLNRSHKELEALVKAMEEVLVEPEKQILLADEFEAD
ncbi:MAG: hypothetical protein ABJE63_08915 [Lentilitoribacter sp.]